MVVGVVSTESENSSHASLHLFQKRTQCHLQVTIVLEQLIDVTKIFDLALNLKTLIGLTSASKSTPYW